MGASVVAYWPGISEEQVDAQPGFWNDEKAWSDFTAERESDLDVKRIIAELGAAPILTFTTEGVSDGEVDWVTPRQLHDAAGQLQAAIRLKRPGTERILAVYERNANRVQSIEQELMQDLEDIRAIAMWAEQQGARVMTLEVNW